jgi:hypothetical protein
LKPITYERFYSCHIYLIILQHCKKRAQTESIVYVARKDNFFIHHTFTGTRHIFTGIDSTGFKVTHASSQYYTERERERERDKLRRRKYAKLSIGADILPNR